jgi:hypothetical protein
MPLVMNKTPDNGYHSRTCVQCTGEVVYVIREGRDFTERRNAPFIPIYDKGAFRHGIR